MATPYSPEDTLHIFTCAVDLIMNSRFYVSDLTRLVDRAVKTLAPAHCMTFLVHVDQKIHNVNCSATQASLHKFIVEMGNEQVDRLLTSRAAAVQQPPQTQTPASAPPLTRENIVTEKGAGPTGTTTEGDSSWVELPNEHIH